MIKRSLLFKTSLFMVLSLLFLATIGGCTQSQESNTPVGVAVEFTDHAACAYIALDKGYFKDVGLKLSAYESYVTGTALAAALARNDIQVAYLCLAPAISAYANAGVPLKIVAGTHKYGYGLVVNPDKIKSVEDLIKPNVRIACVEVGSSADLLLQKIIYKYGLNRDALLENVQRINPPKQILAIRAGKIDAAFLPEQWATMAEDAGFKMLLTAKDIWPGMQGSVLIVKDDLLKNSPETVRKVVEVSKKATIWANENPNPASGILYKELQSTGNQVFPTDIAATAGELQISTELLLRSMNRLEYTTGIDPATVQETIDFMASLGYIKNSFKAEDILDLRFLQ